MVDLLDEMLRLHGRLQAAMRRTAEGTGLSPPMSILLATVACSSEPPTVPRVARALGQSRQSVQRAADHLVSEGYVRWEINPEHRRAQLLVPTELGLKAFEYANASSAAWADRVVAGLDQAVLESTLKTLRGVRRALEQNGREEIRDGAAISQCPLPMLGIPEARS
jgi:DNA-binding MarR family transcriptional regulator